MSMRSRCFALVVLASALNGGLCVEAGAAGVQTQPDAALPPAAKTPAVAPDAGRREELVARLFDLGNSRDHVANWQRLLAGQAIEAADTGASNETRQRLRRAWVEAVSTSFDVDGVMRAWQVGLAARVSLADLEHHMAFETTALGRRLNAISRTAAASQPSQADAARQLAAGQRLVAKDAKRTRVLRRILSAVDMETATADVVCSLQFATLAGVMQERKGALLSDAPDLASLAQQCQSMMRQQLAATLLPSYAEMWAGLSTAELEVYARHVEEPQTRRLVGASHTICTDLVRRSALAVGRSFVREYAAERL